MHGNRSKKPAIALDKSISNTIILLYRTKYQDFNFNHFYDYLVEEEDINVSYHCVYTTLMYAGISSPKARKTTNTIVGTYFDWQETLNGYYNVLKQILVN